MFPDGVPDGTSVVYGPDIPDEGSLRLLGNVEGRRVLELGVGNGRNAVALAASGAKVIAVDRDPERLERARGLADRHDVRVEFHHADPADIAFVRADTIDLVLGVWSLATEPDTDRVLRQAHRVLRPEAPVVLSLPHPAMHTVDRLQAGRAGVPSGNPHRPVIVTHSWFDTSPRVGGGWQETTYPTTLAGLFGGLFRAGFRTELLLEPEPLPDGTPRSAWWDDAMRLLPATVIVRARKLGV